MLLRSAALLALAALSLPAGAAPATPPWVTNGGVSPKHPRDRFLTGYAMAEGPRALESARAQAAASVAAALSVRVEQLVTAWETDGAGGARHEVVALTRTASDLRLEGLAFETWVEAARAHALAVLDRGEASARRRSERDGAAARARLRLEEARSHEAQGEVAAALTACLAAETAALEATGHEVLAAAMLRQSPGAEVAELEALSRSAAARVAALQERSSASHDDALATLAALLRRQGVGEARLEVAPFTYGVTLFSSSFGRESARRLEAALASNPAATSPGGAPLGGPLAARGTYLEAGGEIRLSVLVRNAEDGRAVASAHAAFPEAAVPRELPLKPQNFEEALRDQRVFAEGEEVAGDLRLELWTQRGRRDLVLRRGERVRLHLRVNRPAWVRLSYLLADGTKVVLAQDFHIDASKVNQEVQYPGEFEVAPPFGIEQLHAMAFTARPKPVPTVLTVIEGVPYETVTATRGLRRREGPEQVAEATLTMTTLP